MTETVQMVQRKVRVVIKHPTWELKKFWLPKKLVDGTWSGWFEELEQREHVTGSGDDIGIWVEYRYPRKKFKRKKAKS